LGARYMGRVRKRWVNTLGLECTEIEGLLEKGDRAVVCLPPRESQAQPGPSGSTANRASIGQQ